MTALSLAPIPVSDNAHYLPIRAPAIARVTPARDVLTAYLDSACDSPHTRRAYERHCAAALTFLRCRTLADLRGSDLAAYRARLTASPLAPASQAQALAAVRSFLTWAGTFEAHRLPAEVIRTALRTPRADVRRPYSILTERELAALLGAADNARDRALLAVLAGAGLRAAEAVGLDVGDILEGHEGGYALSVRLGKGRKSRVVPVLDDVAQLVRAYLAQTSRTLASDGPVFRAHDFYADHRPRQRLTTRALEHVVGRTARRADIVAKRVTPHSLRHTFAIRALRYGTEVTALAKLLGHANVATTMRYVDHLETAELRGSLPSLPSTPSATYGPCAAGLSSPDHAQRTAPAAHRQTA